MTAQVATLTAQIIPGTGTLVLGLVPLVVLLLLAILIAGRRSSPENELALDRESLLTAAVLAGVWVVVGTELLSLGRGLSFWPLLLWWVAPGAVIAAMVWRQRPRVRLFIAARHGVPRALWAPVGLTAGAILLAGVVALASPPNTYDALSYHMPRQVFWMQEHSVAHYPTLGAHQLAMPPMAEFAGLHLMVLSGGDVYANLVQWLALVLLAIAGSLIARELGARALGQGMAALLIVSNPMAWQQASSAKNDLVAALWLLIVGYWIVRILRDGRCGPGRWLMLGAAAGLAAMTKLTGLMFVLPLLVLVGLWLLWHKRLVVAPLAATVLAVTLLLNAGHMARNIRMYDSPHASSSMKDTAGRDHSNEIQGPAVIASNVVRNVSLHAGTPSRRVNAACERVVTRIHRWIGLDVNDSRTTAYADIHSFAVGYVPMSEASAPAPVHLWLAVLSVVVLPLAVRGGPRGGSSRTIPAGEGVRTALLLAAVLSGFVLFCALVKWQPWHARLHIGLISLLAPVIAMVLCRGRGGGALVVCGLLLLPLGHSVFSPNASRPLRGTRSVLAMGVPRDTHLLQPHEWPDVEEVLRFAQQVRPRTVGMRIPREYAFQYRLLRELAERPTFTDPMAPIDRRGLTPWPRPDIAVIWFGTRPEFQRMQDRSSGELLYRVRTHGPYGVFTPEHVARRLHAEGAIEELPAFIPAPRNP